MAVGGGGGSWGMGSIGRYIIRTTASAFALILFSLTALIWITQSLREIDLMTSQGQTIVVFFKITAMIIPQLVQVIAPIALMIATAHILNKLATDSELIVMNAAGMPPRHIFAAFLTLALAVSVLVAVLGAYLAPKSFRELRRLAAEVRADFVANIIQPGRFTEIESRLTFHIRERRPDGILLGIMVDDRRDPKEQATIIAEQGEIVENAKSTFLLLNNGSVQRHRADERDPAIVVFDRYAIDLSRFTGGPQTITYSAREYYLWELLFPGADDQLAAREPGNIRAELHDRLAAPLYPLIFVLIIYVYLGAPRTTRQSRSMSLVSAIFVATAIRLIGFANMVMSINTPLAVYFQYLLLLAVFVVGFFAVSRGTIIEPPAVITQLIARATERFSRRFATP